MKEYRVNRLFLLFLFLFLKMDRFNKMHIEKFIWLFNFFIVGRDKFNICLRDSKLYDFYIYLFIFRLFGHIFDRFRYFHIFQYCKKAIPENLTHI